MRLVEDKLPIRPEKWIVTASFRGHAVEIDMTRFLDEFHQIISKINRRDSDSADAINANEGSAIMVQGTVVGDLPDPQIGLQGKIHQLTDPSGADAGYVCIWNGAAYAWLNIY
jgi:hypothetical protein